VAMALLAWRQSDFDAADRFAVEAVRIRRELGDDMDLGLAIGILAFVRIGGPSARSTVQEQLSIAMRLGDPRLQAEALMHLGLLEGFEMNLDPALDHLSQSLALYETLGEGVIPPTVENGIGWVLLMLHRAAEARPLVARGLLTRLRSRDVIDMAGSLDASAEIAFELGARERAMRLKGASDAIRGRAGSTPTMMAAASRNRWVARAEQALGKAAHAAWLEGGRLTPDEAGAYALSPLDQPPPRAGALSTSLSSRENQVAELVAGGLSNDEIANRLRLSRRTVEAHLDHIRTKLGVRSRVDVATWVTAKSIPPSALRS
jgi:DNA-binding CsgD family transcriptional regulator